MRSLALLLPIGLCLSIYGCGPLAARLEAARAERETAAAEAAAAPALTTVRESTLSFESEGKTIPVERFLPSQPGNYPIVLMLHGADGLQVEAFNLFYRAQARDLARRGYAVFFPHYFEKTGTKFAGPVEMFREFAPWLVALRDLATWAGKQPECDADRLGLLGFSLGASLVLSGATADPRVKAVAEYFGPLPEYFAQRMTRMPPVLILHGDKDPLVPVKAAYDLEALLKQKKIPYEMQIYPGQGHGFPGPDGKDAMERVAGFFGKHLGPAAK